MLEIYELEALLTHECKLLRNFVKVIIEEKVNGFQYKPIASNARNRICGLLKSESEKIYIVADVKTRKFSLAVFDKKTNTFTNDLEIKETEIRDFVQKYMSSGKSQ